MKKYFTILPLLCFALMYSQITVKVEYESISKPKINHNGFNFTQSQKDEIERQALQIAKKPEKYVLNYYDGNSFFQRDPSEKLPYAKQKTESFRIKDKKGFYNLKDFIVEEFYGFYSMDNVSIEFTNETQTIENYNCKLALYKIGDDVSKVWYTEDIPISAGPYNFYKVPGLILKVQNSNLLCYATNVSKNVNTKDIKKMDASLKIYEGEELTVKISEGRKKMLGSKRQKAEEMFETMKNDKK